MKKNELVYRVIVFLILVYVLIPLVFKFIATHTNVHQLAFRLVRIDTMFNRFYRALKSLMIFKKPIFILSSF